MEKGIYVKDIMPNTEVDGLFVTMDPALSQGKNGPYWKLLLSDSTGSIEARIWAPLSVEIAPLEGGAIALINGKASIYKECVQVNINVYEALSPQEMTQVDIGEFVPASPFDREEMFSSLNMACMEEFTYAPWRKLVSAVLKNPEIRKALMEHPAAKSMHHAYAGGLLEHSLAVFNLCRSICDLYPNLDRQTLLAGALFHDIGKIREFSGGLTNDYTDEGRLVGHISLGLEILEPFLAKSGLSQELKSHLKHLILSHHGLHEYGAPCLPQTAEAFILHYADNMDAKMNQLGNLFEEQDKAQWSLWQSSLGRKIFRPIHTPAQDNEEHGEKNGASGQCLSLWKE